MLSLPRVSAALAAVLAFSLVVAGPGRLARAQTPTVYTWNTTVTANGWLNSANWTSTATGTFAGQDANPNSTADGSPGSVAAFTTWASGTTVGIDFGTSGNTGAGNDTAANGLLELGAINFNGTTSGLTIGKSDTTSATGVLRLGGATVNPGSGDIANVLISVSNTATQNLTIAPNAAGGTGTMSLQLGITNGAFYVNTGRTLTISTRVTELTALSGFTKLGGGTLTLSGTLANTYTGLTTVSGGVLNLGKTTNVVAVPGDVSITGGALYFSANSLANLIATTATVTVTGGALNSASATPNSAARSGITQTLAGVSLSGNGSFSPGATSNWTVTGGFAVTGGAGAIYVGNSGASVTAGSLTITAMTATAGGTVTTANSFTVYGAGSARSTLTVGSGGLSLNGSRINLRRGGSGNLGSLLVLNGNVTTTGTAASFITEDTAGGTNGTRDISLSGTAGSFTRTFTVGGGGADLTVGVPITNGTATTGGITKAGPGTLTLSGANTYTGLTTVNAGTLAYGANDVLAAGGVTVDGATAVLDLLTFSDTVGTVVLANGGAIAGTTGVLTGAGYDVRSGSVSARLAGTGVALTKTTADTVILSGTNSYTGGTVVGGGVLRFNTAASVPSTGTVVVSAGATAAAGYALDPTFLSRLDPSSAGVAALAVDSANNLSLTGFPNLSLGAVGGTLASPVVLSGTLASNGTDYRLGGGGGVLKVTGDLTDAVGVSVAANGTPGGTVILAGTGNAIAGTVTVNPAATLVLGATAAIPAGVGVSLAGGTFSTAGGAAGAGVPSNALGNLGVLTSSTLALGTAPHAVSFAAPVYTSGTLTVTGWQGPANGNGTAGRIVFTAIGTDPAAANAAYAPFLGGVAFDQYPAGGTFVSANGGTALELVPVPEPATVLGLAAAGLGLAGWVRRRVRGG